MKEQNIWMRAETHQAEHAISINVWSSFNYEQHFPFAQLIDTSIKEIGKCIRVTVDMFSLKKLDPTALGLLLLMREKLLEAFGNDIHIEIVNMCKEVRQYLESSHFPRLFVLN